jgi:hypothetical protein
VSRQRCTGSRTGAGRCSDYKRGIVQQELQTAQAQAGEAAGAAGPDAAAGGKGKNGKGGGKKH